MIGWKQKEVVYYRLLLLLSPFSSVRLCATPKMAAHQAPPSLGFSRQEHWSGLPFPSPMHESEVAQSCLTPSDPMDCRLPGFSIHGIFQARVLEWGAIAFSNNIYKVKLIVVTSVSGLYQLGFNYRRRERERQSSCSQGICSCDGYGKV